MRLSINKKIIPSLFILLTAALQAAAGPVLHNLEIEVSLKDNGDADIVEMRTMTIDNEGTECYIVIGNLAGSNITDFRVTDESGAEYINEGKWNVNRTRIEKARRCGIVTKSDGYELCWGLGMPGERTYIVRYTVTDLVRDYGETDGFNYMFVTRNMKPSPQEASVTIKAPHLANGLPKDSVRVWSFGFYGENEIADGEVVSYTTEPMTEKSAMIVMLELDKGILHPTMHEKETFEEVKERAFEGSDYKELAWYQKLWNFITEEPGVFFGLLLGGLLGLWAIWSGIRVSRERKKLLKTIDWYRDIPINGDLVHARGLFDAFYLGGGITDEDMISAMVLRLIRTGTLTIEDRIVLPTGLRRIMGAEGKVQPCIIIKEFNERNRLINAAPIRKLYDMFRMASGEDLVLQPRELKKWMGRHEDEVMAFVKLLKESVSLKQAKAEIEDTKKVFGLKKYLQDFTLANERHVSEVSLWNDYLVYATLFGIADQVMADMKQINPEYLQMNQISRNLTDRRVVPMLLATTSSTATSIKQSVESRNSGGGGRSSFGGGGGFHGGGSGGGVR
ncbi:MAG: DUF2207 domain-containing protein [Prevotella sp.]|nr:DUF2207 domain-containing protein [Prevotella sp.]